MKVKVIAMVKKAAGNSETGTSWHEYLICDYKTTVQEIYTKIGNGSKSDIVLSFGVIEKE